MLLKPAPLACHWIKWMKRQLIASTQNDFCLIKYFSWWPDNLRRSMHFIVTAKLTLPHRKLWMSTCVFSRRREENTYFAEFSVRSVKMCLSSWLELSRQPDNRFTSLFKIAPFTYLNCILVRVPLCHPITFRHKLLYLTFFPATDRCSTSAQVWYRALTTLLISHYIWFRHAAHHEEKGNCFFHFI